MDRLNRMLHAAQGMGMGMGSAAPGGVSILIASLLLRLTVPVEGGMNAVSTHISYDWLGYCECQLEKGK